jgi:hypothetical protein
MSINKLSMLADLFYSLAKDESLPKNSKDIKTILKNIDELDTFASRIKYAEKNLSHLSSGSARLVLLTPGGTVVKLAKNEKGIAQNKAESNPKMKSKYLNKILSNSKQFNWIETHHLDKISSKEFEKLTSINFDDFGEAISYSLKESSKKKPKILDKIKDNLFYKEMVRLGKDFDLLPGDMERISSWGTKDDLPILIDSGLTKEIYKEFYE